MTSNNASNNTYVNGNNGVPPPPPPPPRTRTANTNKNKWDQMFTALLAFQRQYHHCAPPRSYEYGNLKLGAWVVTQRQQFKHGSKLSSINNKDRYCRLMAIGFPTQMMSSSDGKWLAQCNKLVYFHGAFGHCQLYYDAGRGEGCSDWCRDDPAWLDWYNDQKEKNMYGLICEDRLKLLEQLDPEWDGGRVATATATVTAGIDVRRTMHTTNGSVLTKRPTKPNTYTNTNTSTSTNAKARPFPPLIATNFGAAAAASSPEVTVSLVDDGDDIDDDIEDDIDDDIDTDSGTDDEQTTPLPIYDEVSTCYTNNNNRMNNNGSGKPKKKRKSILFTKSTLTAATATDATTATAAAMLSTSLSPTAGTVNAANVANVANANSIVPQKKARHLFPFQQTTETMKGASKNDCDDGKQEVASGRYRPSATPTRNESTGNVCTAGTAVTANT